LNRTFPGKQTFVLDFFNDPKDVLEAFLPYYTKAELEGVSDAQVVYDLQTALDQEQIYHWNEVESFATAFYDTRAAASKLTYYCQPAKERFTKRYKNLLDEKQSARDARKRAENDGDKVGLTNAEKTLKDIGEGLDQLDLFKKNLTSFVRAYEFLSQIISYEDRELEQFCVFAKHLSPLLRIDRLDDDEIDVSELALTHYRLTKRNEQQLKLSEESEEYALKPLSDVGSGKAHDPEKKRLSEIIDTLNDLFGSEVNDEDQLHFAQGVADRIRRDDSVMAQVNSHSPEQVMHGLFPKRVSDMVLDAMTDHEKLSMEVLGDEQTQRGFALLILRMLAGSKTVPREL